MECKEDIETAKRRLRMVASHLSARENTLIHRGDMHFVRNFDDKLVILNDTKAKDAFRKEEESLPQMMRMIRPEKNLEEDEYQSVNRSPNSKDKENEHSGSTKEVQETKNGVREKTSEAAKKAIEKLSSVKEKAVEKGGQLKETTEKRMQGRVEQGMEYLQRFAKAKDSFVDKAKDSTHSLRSKFIKQNHQRNAGNASKTDHRNDDRKVTNSTANRKISSSEDKKSDSS